MLNIDLVYAFEDARSVQLRNDLRDAPHMLDLPPKWDEHEGDPRPSFADGRPGPQVYLGGRPIQGADGSPGSRSRILLALQEQMSRR